MQFTKKLRGLKAILLRQFKRLTLEHFFKWSVHAPVNKIKPLTQGKSSGLCDSPLERGGGVCSCALLIACRTHPCYRSFLLAPSQEGTFKIAQTLKPAK